MTWAIGHELRLLQIAKPIKLSGRISSFSGFKTNLLKNYFNVLVLANLRSCRNKRRLGRSPGNMRSFSWVRTLLKIDF
ncbi:MAG: hypothetical protein C5B47_05940 [Verrucomicrobia bacterium]|nr:MAG: hypothetical protein C5B47_05940 [Verrucomicrobiota bacterium]